MKYAGLFAILIVIACQENRKEFTYSLPDHIPEINWPNGQKPTVGQIELGRLLFHTKDLSGDRSLSCASCHLRGFALADTAAISRGVHGIMGFRNTPSLYNLAWQEFFFYEGGVKEMDRATLVPMLSEDELDLSAADLAQRFRESAYWRGKFLEVYDTLPDYTSIVRTLALFQYTLISVDAPYDSYIERGFPPEVERGRELFFSDSLQCSTCHIPPFFNDQQFHDLGLPVSSDDPDWGRGRFTHDTSDYYHFKTPSLRNVELTAPYMHDGSVATLDSVIRFYEHGGGPRESTLKPFRLSEGNRKDLLLFLQSLSGEEAKKRNAEATAN